MVDIRYICLSDLHLGEEDSLLTALGPGPGDVEPAQLSPVTEQLARCLGTIRDADTGPAPTLVLAGDVLELALARTHQAARSFAGFCDRLLSARSAWPERIVYLPGNHDHHLWETARERMYAEYVAGLPPHSPLLPPWHVSNIVPKRVIRSPLLDAACRHVGRQIDVTLAYPNLALRPDETAPDRYVFITHGHYGESLYHAVTRLRNWLFPARPEPLTPWDIEEENFAWIDFFWSAMGRAGRMGRHMESIYEHLADRQDRRTLANYLARRVGESHWLGRLARPAVQLALTWLALTQRTPEKHRPARALTRASRSDLDRRVVAPMLRQLVAEKLPPPTAVKLVFGHTHKPFVERCRLGGLTEPVEIHNTGGWVVESRQPHPIHGASVVLIDSAGHVATIRLFDEQPGDRPGPVRLVAPANETGDGLHAALSQALDLDQPPWTDLAEAISTGLTRRRRRRAERLDRRRHRLGG